MASHEIVILSDDPTFGHVVAKQFVKAGYTPWVYRDEVAAFAFARDRRPAGLVLDVTLKSGVSGTMTVERIRSDARIWHLPIAVCSYDSRFLAIYDTYLRGRGCDVFGKPFDFDAVLASIRHRSAVTSGVEIDAAVIDASAHADVY